jgi:hypothetical protein
MSIVLMAVGLLVAAAGFVTVGFGIPINAFSLGNTLIISGTIAVTSGLILIALAVVVGHLRRLADALRDRPAWLAHSSGAQPAPAVAAAAEPAAVRVSAPPGPEPAAAPQEASAVEPRFSATASEAPGPLDWLRVKAKPAGGAPAIAVEPPVVEVVDEAPLSPKPPQRSAMPSAIEPALEPKLWSPSRPGGPLEPRVAPPAPRAAPQVETQKERERFDLVWPDRAAPPPPPSPSPAPQSSEPIKRESALEMPLPPIPARPRDSRPSERRAEPFAPKPAAERGPAILKSGVIDGMPYTLYADGSIEADLPTGTVKFASVDALRAHLEKQG